MTATNNSAEWAGCRATKGASASGKYYFESRISDARNGICRVGWSTLSDSLNLGSSATSMCKLRRLWSRLRFWRHGKEGEQEQI